MRLLFSVALAGLVFGFGSARPAPGNPDSRGGPEAAHSAAREEYGLGRRDQDPASCSCEEDDPVVYAKLKALSSSPSKVDPSARTYFPPPESQGGWRKLDDPDSIRRVAGMDPDRLKELRAWLRRSDNRNSAAVVIRRGYIVLEEERGNSATSDSRQVASCSKAICATVLAIASKQSRQRRTPIRMSFDDKAFDFIPWAQPLSDPRKAAITRRARAAVVETTEKPGSDVPAGKVTEGTVFGVRDTRFTLGGEPTFLLGMSYYGALGATQEFVRSDLDALRRHGFNWMRVWATWRAFDRDVSAVDAEGGPREPYLGRLKWLVAECDRRSLIVDVTLTRGDGTNWGAIPDLKAHQRAIETLVGALRVHRNWYLDLANERDVRDGRHVPPEDLKTLRDQVRRLSMSHPVSITRIGSSGAHRSRLRLIIVPQKMADVWASCQLR
jgi:hypothetical protein